MIYLFSSVCHTYENFEDARLYYLVYLESRDHNSRLRRKYQRFCEIVFSTQCEFKENLNFRSTSNIFWLRFVSTIIVQNDNASFKWKSSPSSSILWLWKFTFKSISIVTSNKINSLLDIWSSSMHRSIFSQGSNIMLSKKRKFSWQ